MKMFILLVIVTFIAQLILPWWIILPITFLVSFYFNKKPWRSFIIGFTALFLLWTFYSFYLSWMNDHLLANRIGLLLGLAKSNINWLWVVLLSGLPAAIIAGLAGLAGQYTRKAFTNL